MSELPSKQDDPAPIGRLIGAFYILVGAVGFLVLLFAGRPHGLEALSEPLVIVGMTVLFLILIVIGLFLAVPKRNPEARFLR